MYIFLQQNTESTTINHIEDPPLGEPPPPLRNGKSKSEQNLDKYHCTCHENSAYIDDEEDGSFSEIHKGTKMQ